MAGLPIPSVIRTAKIATIEAGDAAKLGKVPRPLFARVAKHLARELLDQFIKLGVGDDVGRRDEDVVAALASARCSRPRSGAT
jgi:hypothetical protein